MTFTTSKEPESRRALLAEDDALIRELVASYLERLGFAVHEVSNGRDALDLIENVSPNKYDLVVTDILMPKANGDQLIKAARQNQSCNRFLVMSGNLAEYSRNLDKSHTGSRFIEKPFTFRDFESKLNSLYSPTVSC